MAPQNDLPPWLQDDEPEPPGKPASSSAASTPPARRPPVDDGSGLPPWLQGEDETRLTDESGGLSASFLAAADSLAESASSELTYDQWYASQQERRRERSIEEDVPDIADMSVDLNAINPTELSQTGELPDWFLGLDELDTSDAPDWFTEQPRVGAKTEPLTFLTDDAAETNPPTPVEDFLSVLGRGQTPSTPPPAAPSSGGIDGLFSTFSAQDFARSDEDESPDLNWFNEPETPAETYDSVGMDDLFQALKAAKGAPASAPADELPDEASLLGFDRSPASSFTDDLPGDFGIGGSVTAAQRAAFEFAASSPADEEDDIPPDFNFGSSDTSAPAASASFDFDLDDELPPEFDFGSSASSPSSTFDFDFDDALSGPGSAAASADFDPFADILSTSGNASADIEDPDLDFFIADPQKPPTPDPLTTFSAFDEEPARAPVSTSIDDPNTLSWLSEIQGIVSAVESAEEANNALFGADADDPSLSFLKTGTGFSDTEPPAESRSSSIGANFDWGDAGVSIEEAAQEAAEEPPIQTGWLRALDPNDALGAAIEEQAEAEPPPSPPPAPDAPRPSLLTGRLARMAGLVPDTPSQQPAGTASSGGADQDLFASLPDADAPGDGAGESGLIVEELDWDSILSGTGPDNVLPPLEPDSPAEDEPFSLQQYDQEQGIDDDFIRAVTDDSEDDLSSIHLPSLNALFDEHAAEHDLASEALLEDYGSQALEEIRKTASVEIPAVVPDELEEMEWLTDEIFTDEATAIPDDAGAVATAERADEEPMKNDFDDLFGDDKREDDDSLSEFSPPSNFFEDDESLIASEDDVFAADFDRISTDNLVAQESMGDTPAYFDPMASLNDEEDEITDDEAFGSLVLPTTGMLSQYDHPLTTSRTDDTDPDSGEQEETSPNDDRPFGGEPPAHKYPGTVDAQTGAILPEMFAEDPLAEDAFARDETFPGVDSVDDSQPAFEDDSFSALSFEDVTPDSDVPPLDDIFAMAPPSRPEPDLPLSFDDIFGSEGDPMGMALGEDSQPDSAPAFPHAEGDISDEALFAEQDTAGAGEEFDALFGDPGLPEADTPAFATSSLPDDTYYQPADSGEQDVLEDLFSSYGQAPEPEDEDLPDLASAFSQVDEAAEELPADDFFAAFSQEPTPEEAEPADDFFAAFDQQADTADDDWLTKLDIGDDTGMLTQGDDAPAPRGTDHLRVTPLSQTLFTDEFTESGQAESAAGKPRLSHSIEDIDSYLASLSSDETPEVDPETARMFSLTSQDVDLDSFLDSMADEPDKARSSVRPFTEDDSTLTAAPDWLNELQGSVSVSEVSASAQVRQRRDRPEGELDNRLKKLRQRGEEIPTGEEPVKGKKTTQDALQEVLPGISGDTLAPAAISAGRPTAFVGGLALTPDQLARADMLKTLVAAINETRRAAGTSAEEELVEGSLSAIELTYDQPWMQELSSDESTILLPTRDPSAPAARPATTAAQAKARKPRARARTRPRLRIDRFLIAVVLAIAVCAPFLLPNLRVGDTPPNAFAAGSPAAIAFDRIETLPPGSLVLVAVEYGAASAAEMDSLADALLRHLLLRGAYPVVVGGDAIGLLHVETLLRDLNADTAFLARLNVDRLERNQDYFVTRYLVGEAIGVRALVGDNGRYLINDIRGQATNLALRSIGDFQLILVMADRADSARSYAEQIAPVAAADVIAAVSYGAAPLVEPYLNAAEFSGAPAGLVGAVIGFSDAYTYNTLIGNTGSSFGAAAVSGVDRGDRPAPILATLTPTPTATFTPTFTPSMTFTPSRTPTATATPTPMPIAANNSGQAINVREGPSTNARILTQLAPGDRVEVMGVSENGDWILVQLQNAERTVGFVSAPLITILEPADDGAFAVPGRLGKQIGNIRQGDGDEAPPTRTPTRTRTTSAARTPLPVGTDVLTEAAGDATTEASASPTRTASNTRTPAPTRTPSPAATNTPTPSRTPTLTPSPTFTPEPTAIIEIPASGILTTQYREQRWTAMTLGILVSIVIIGGGAVYHVMRAFLRRRR